jgi:hypothetical protein
MSISFVAAALLAFAGAAFAQTPARFSRLRRSSGRGAADAGAPSRPSP